jgi:type II secretory ATPase GspE/PulE/Tfp pilus assembly ATPase PilB-like protein
VLASHEEMRDLGIDVASLPEKMRTDVVGQYPGFEPLELGANGLPWVYRAVGCERCQGTGYQGRTGMHELLLVTDAIRTLVLKNADSTTMKRQGIKDGMHTIRDSGAAKVLAGVTSPEEVARVTQEDIE